MAAALHDRDEKEEYLEYVRNQLGKFDQVNGKGSHSVHSHETEAGTEVGVFIKLQPCSSNIGNIQTVCRTM